MEKQTAPAKATLSAAGIAAALVLGAWCGPASASSGISIECSESSKPLASPVITPSPALTAHTETALAEILDDEAVRLPTLVEAVTESSSESAEEVEEDRDAAETPAIITRLPGVSEAALPSFRRQMYRTDI